MEGPPCILIAGPTGVGKSEIAVALAEQIGGEIISVDSMQVYRGLDIGTAKPDAATRTKVPHHLINVCDLTEPFDAGKFVRLAGEAVNEIRLRKKVPIFCGGTGLYFSAFFGGLGDVPPPDPRLRAELEDTPLQKLLEELRARDGVMYNAMDRQNRRRVIRAVEVMRMTGKEASHLRADWTTARPGRETDLLRCFSRGAEDLRQRIDKRVEKMFHRGLVDETRELLRRGLAENRTAMQSIGYRQVAEHLGGARNLADTIELVKTRTRQFAKRQRTWFRRHGNFQWIELESQEPLPVILPRCFGLVMR